jgi:hypothetical protein
VLASSQGLLCLGNVTLPDIELGVVPQSGDDVLLAQLGPQVNGLLVSSLGLLPPLIVPVHQSQVVKRLSNDILWLIHSFIETATD